MEPMMPDRLRELDGETTGAVRIRSSVATRAGDATHQRVGMVHRRVAPWADVVAWARNAREPFGGMARIRERARAGTAVAPRCVDLVCKAQDGIASAFAPTHGCREAWPLASWAIRSTTLLGTSVCLSITVHSILVLVVALAIRRRGRCCAEQLPQSKSHHGGRRAATPRRKAAVQGNGCRWVGGRDGVEATEPRRRRFVRGLALLAELRAQRTRRRGAVEGLGHVRIGLRGASPLAGVRHARQVSVWAAMNPMELS